MAKSPDKKKAGGKRKKGKKGNTTNKYFALDTALLEAFESFIRESGLRQGTAVEAAIFFIMRIPASQRDAVIRALMAWKETEPRAPLALPDPADPEFDAAAPQRTVAS